MSIFSRCYATLHPALLVRRSVGPYIRHTYFFVFFLWSLASQLLPKWSSDLKYIPCPPARDWGSCVSGLVHFLCEFFVRPYLVIKEIFLQKYLIFRCILTHFILLKSSLCTLDYRWKLKRIRLTRGLTPQLRLLKLSWRKRSNHECSCVRNFFLSHNDGVCFFMQNV